jgi:hypothetical protein
METDDAGAARRRLRQLVADVSFELLGGKLKVAGATHTHEVRIQVEHDRRLRFACMEMPGLPVEQIGNADIP